MKVAKNMDSVFANCTDDELEFDVFFDDDDTIIDVVAGLDENGNPVTGEDFDFESLAEASEDDMVGENPDFNYQKDGDVSGSEKDAEGTKDEKLEIGGEVGDGKEVTGKENSAESNADDVKDEEEAIGFNDKQQTSLEATEEGPLEDDDQAERAGEVDDSVVETEAAALDRVLNAIDEAEEKEFEDLPEEPIAPEGEVDEKCCKEESEVEVPESDFDKEVDNTDYSEGEGDAPAGVEEAMDEIDFLLNAFDEADEIEVDADNLTEEDDTAEREGEVKHDTSDVEGVKQEVPAVAIDGDNKEDPIEDDCDCAAREGDVKPDKNVEGADATPIGAANEAADDGYLDGLLDALDDDDDLIDLIDAETIVDDSVKIDGESNNNIKVEEATKAEELLDDPDDEDIEAIDGDNEPVDSEDYEYELDDDELIDAVDQGIDPLL